MSRTYRFDTSDADVNIMTRDRMPRQGRKASQGRARTGGYAAICDLRDALEDMEIEVSEDMIVDGSFL